MKSGKFNIEHIIQEDPCGCMVACLAMVRGCNYQTVRQDFFKDFETDGITMGQAASYLGDYGYTVISKRLEYTNHPHDGRKFLCEPFADVHIVCVTDFADSNFDHGIVMLNKGKILNPRMNGNTDIDRYYRINSVLGVWN